MPFYRCTICQEDGSPIAENVTVTIEVTDRDGEPSWYGTITTTHMTPLAAGQRYHLILEDGRTGEFAVRRNTFAGGTARAVAINGLGALS